MLLSQFCNCLSQKMIFDRKILSYPFMLKTNIPFAAARLTASAPVSASFIELVYQGAQLRHVVSPCCCDLSIFSHNLTFVRAIYIYMFSIKFRPDITIKRLAANKRTVDNRKASFSLSVTSEGADSCA